MLSQGFRQVFARFSPGFRKVFARFSRGFRFKNTFVKGSREHQFLCAAGARARGAADQGPRGTQKLIIICFFCSPEPFTKKFLKRKPRENLAKTLRKPRENF